MVRSTAVPSPIWPYVLSPQHSVRPDLVSAQVCAPAAISTIGGSPATSTGTFDGSIVPLPSCPSALLPQQ